MSINLHPAPGYALIKLGGYYKGVVVPEGKYDTHQEGLCIEAAAHQKYHDAWYDEVVGKTVYFSEFTEGKRVTIDKVEYAFVKLTDIQGATIE